VLGSRGPHWGIEERRICSLVLAKWADYRPALPSVQLRFLAREPYLESARHDRRVCEELAVGWFGDFDEEFRDPVLADPDAELVTVCPSIMRDVVAPEPPRIQRAVVEGAFLRRLFRLLVDGDGWQADAQVRAVMARHFSFQLVALEAVESRPRADA
jgi:hypothetical protein